MFRLIPPSTLISTLKKSQLTVDEDVVNNRQVIYLNHHSSLYSLLLRLLAGQIAPKMNEWIKNKPFFMYRNTVVFGVTWRAACSLHLPTNECEITGCSWSTFSSDLFEHLCIFFFIFFQHKLRFTSTHKHKHAPSLFHWMTVLCMGQNGSGQTFKHTHTHTSSFWFSADSDGHEYNHFY